jgi:hypothetical protein
MFRVWATAVARRYRVRFFRGSGQLDGWTTRQKQTFVAQFRSENRSLRLMQNNSKILLVACCSHPLRPGAKRACGQKRGSRTLPFGYV